jgi:hypothetical protein
MNRLLTILFLALTASSASAQKLYTIEGSVVSIRAQRPLWVAAEVARERFGVPVSYEDAKTVHPGDIVDQRTPEARERNPGARALGRIQEILNIELPDSAQQGRQRREIAAQFLQTAVSEHVSRGNNGQFEVLENQFGFVIVPRGFRGKSGKTEIQVSPLDARITIPPARMTLRACLEIFVAAVSNISGAKVTIGLTPNNYVDQTAGVCQAANETARDVLDRVIYFPRTTNIGTPADPSTGRVAYVWHLLGGVADDSYTLSITPALHLQKSRFGGFDLREITINP